MKDENSKQILTDNQDSGKAPDETRVDMKRYKKVRSFFLKAFIHAVFWDIFLNRKYLRVFRKDPVSRWQKTARDFRSLALEMGGVLIKLGQFLSIRVDILPLEVTRELAGLQDEVPPEPIEKILQQLENDFEKPVSRVFADFEHTPLGAASLAQAHKAVLPTGEPVVVKVMRPDIDVIVETDLSAINLALKWLKMYKRVRKRVDLDWLSREFSSVTRRELETSLEGKNAEQFAMDFMDNETVYIPKIHWEYTRKRCLTMEDVSYLRIADTEAIEKTGIDRSKVADALHGIYMHQVFETNFVHVDPHPGNLFVRPLPTAEEMESGKTGFCPGEEVPYRENRPFQIAFVDFGMTATIPKRLRASLRQYVVGVGTHDAYKVVQSFVSGGTLLQGADLRRLEEVHEAMFERLWGVRMGQIKSIAMGEARYFLKEYRDVIYDAPFQFQVDMLFVMRAVGILSGMTTNLDPDFDPWTKTVPYAEKFIKEEFKNNWQGVAQEGFNIARLLTKLPQDMDRFLGRANRGRLSVQTDFSKNTKELILRVDKGVRRLSFSVMASGCVIAGALLYQGKGNCTEIGYGFWITAFILFLLGFRNNNGA